MDINDQMSGEMFSVLLIIGELIETIDIAEREQRVTVQRAADMKDWLAEFINASLSPPENRKKRMAEIIEKGKAQFKEDDLFKDILVALGYKTPQKCKSCDGTGWRQCSKCEGSGQLYGKTPPDYVGMPIRSVCDSCYGNGGDECSMCKGKGYV